MLPDKDPSPEEIEKMLENARMKPVPPQILKGFKDDVMRRIEADRRVKPGRWAAAGWKLPRVGMSVGAGALACLAIAAISTLTTQMPSKSPTIQVASVPAPAAMSLPATAARMMTAAPDQAKAAISGVQPAVQRPAVHAASVPAQKLTVEEELRLIEEFDDQRFFIRQDITDDALASA